MKKDTVVKPRSKRSSHDLSCQSLTTTDLFKIKPVFSRLIIPNDHFNIKTSQINRVDSLPVSSFVNIKNRLAWFYVKHCQVWKPWDAFITQAPYAFGGTNTVPSSVPYVGVLDLSSLFITYGYYTLGLVTSSVITSSVQNIDDLYQVYENDSYDKIYCVLNSDSTINYVYGYKFTPKGRLVYDILYSLGYRFPDIMIEGDSAYNTDRFNMSSLHMSLLPLMSYLSVLVNYYVPIKFRNYAFINSFSYLVTPYSSHVTSAFGASFSSDVESFWSNVVNIIISVYYGSDYFTDSLINPYKGVQSVMRQPGDSYDGSGTEPYTNVNATQHQEPYMILRDGSDVGGEFNYLTQYYISALQALTSKSQLAALSQNDIVGRALSMFGYKPEVADMVPALLSRKNSNIYVSPEVATADTFDSGTGEGTPLGYKAGRGEGTITDYHCKFDFDNYGSLLCVSSVSPDIMYTSGIHREMLHTNRDLCFDPAYVNLGPQAISNAEVSMQMPWNSPDGSVDNDPIATFGFQNRYAELGYRRDFMSGDFVMRSRNTGLDAFHFNRKIDGWNIFNNGVFALARYGQANSPYGQGQYDRIFFDQNSQNDHIQQWNIFEINADRDIPYNGEMSVGDDNNGKEQEVGRPSEVMNA